MKKMNGKPLLLALCLAAALLLAACSPKPAPVQSASQSSSQSSSASTGTDSSAADSSAETEGAQEEEQTLNGTVNVVDQKLELLVLVLNGTYYKFDSAKVDISTLSPGDDVMVTYTGTLDPDDPDSMGVLVSFSKYAD